MRTLLIVALLLGAARAGGDEIIDRVMAVVGGDVITLANTRAAIELALVKTAGSPDPLATALSYLIDRQLMLQEVNRYLPPEPDRAAIDRRLADLRARFASAAALDRTMAVGGLDEDGLRALVRDDLRIEAYLAERFAAPALPTEEEAAEYYREHQAEFVQAGRTLTFAEARTAITERLVAVRRRALVAEWVAGLRRRVEVTQLYVGK